MHHTASARFGLVTCTVAVVFAQAGCDEKVDTPAPPTAMAEVVGMDERVHQVGETASNGVFELRVLGVKTCGVEAHFQPPAGIKKLGVEVEISARGDAEVPANPFYGLIVDAGGERFESTLAGCKPVLEAQRVRKGQSARGWISFDVPEDLRDGRFRYAPVVIGAGKKQLEFALDGRPSAP